RFFNLSQNSGSLRFPATASLIRRNRDLKYTLFRYFQAQISLFLNNFPETQTRNLNQHPQLQGQRILNISSIFQLASSE
ncbi:hypothetical protein, partial [Victivallis lenta]|uniref:hypothetical protein n=1 Tax=Victivallis lenta TaxID=2606640 RepID=UPI00197F72C2